MDISLLTLIVLCFIRSWLNDIRVREDLDKRKVLNDSQFEVVKKVAEHICDKTDALVTEDCDSLPEPLRWSMHGGPGAGQNTLSTSSTKRCLNKS